MPEQIKSASFKTQALHTEFVPQGWNSCQSMSNHYPRQKPTLEMSNRFSVCILKLFSTFICLFIEGVTEHSTSMEVLFFQHGGPGNQALGVRLGSKHLYLLSYLAHLSVHLMMQLSLD